MFVLLFVCMYCCSVEKDNSSSPLACFPSSFLAHAEFCLLVSVLSLLLTRRLPQKRRHQLHFLLHVRGPLGKLVCFTSFEKVIFGISSATVLLFFQRGS